MTRVNPSGGREILVVNLNPIMLDRPLSVGRLAVEETHLSGAIRALNEIILHPSSLSLSLQRMQGRFRVLACAAGRPSIVHGPMSTARKPIHPWCSGLKHWRRRDEPVLLLGFGVNVCRSVDRASG